MTASDNTRVRQLMRAIGIKPVPAALIAKAVEADNLEMAFPVLVAVMSDRYPTDKDGRATLLADARLITALAKTLNANIAKVESLDVPEVTTGQYL